MKSDIFVADFPLDPHFLASIFLRGLLVGIKAISCFQIVYKFQPFSKSQSLVTLLQDTCIFIGSVASVPTTKLNLGMNLIGS